MNVINKTINKMERKFGKYAVPNFMYYIIILYVAGVFVDLINPTFYPLYLSLDINAILHGQVWRLVTFLIQSPSNTVSSGTGILFLVIELYLYYMIGTALENAWGAFRFNLYFISGILFNILATVILYIITGFSIPLGLTYINQSMFFAFAALYPNMQFLLFFIIPVKVKYLAALYGILIGYQVFNYLVGGQIVYAIAIIVALANFLLFFFGTKNYNRYNPKEIRRKRTYKKQVNQTRKGQTTRHKCAVCGRTELDDDTLEFRFCSRCDGNYEYCSDHLFTHEHVHK